MPFVNLDGQPIGDPADILPGPTPAEIRQREGIGARESLAAGIELSNPLASVARMGAEWLGDLAYPETFQPETGFTVRQQDLEGYDGYYHELVGAQSPAELEWLKRRVDRQRRRRDALVYGGTWSALGTLIGSAASPSSIMGAASLPARGSLALSIGSTSLRTAGKIGGTAAIEELVLHAADPERTFGESALNVGIATAAGAVIGALKGVQPMEAAELAARYADDFDAAETAFTGIKPGILDPDGVGAAATPGGAAELGGETLTQRRAAAQARADELRGDEGLVSAYGTENLGWNPIIRLLKSQSLAARDAIGRLTEISMYQAKNMRGVASVTSAWEKYRARRAGLAEAMRETESQWLAYRERLATTGDKVEPTVARQTARDAMLGRNGAMSFADFRQKVAWAKSQLDDPAKVANHELEVLQAAQAWEKHVYGPLGKDADELDLFSYRLRREKERLEEKLTTTKEANKVKALQDRITQLESRIDAARKGVHRPGYINRIYLVPEILGRRAQFKTILRSHLRITDQEADKLIERLIRRNGFSPADADATGTAAALHERSLREIPDEALEGFIERDVFALGQRYHRTMGTDVELGRAFSGEIDLKSVRDEIAQEYAMKIRGEVDPERIAKLRRQRDRDLKDIADVRDMYRGTFAIADDPTRFTSRAIRFAKYWNTMTQLTGAIAAIPDMGRLVMRHGLERTFRTALEPLFKNIGAYKLAKKELNLAGEALDLYLGTRSALFADIADTFATSTRFERLVGKAANLSFTLNLMNHWTDAIKSVTSMIAGTRILEDAARWADGTIDDAAKARLANLGIDKDLAEKITKQSGTHQTKFDHVVIANTDLWGDELAVEAFRSALAKDVNITIVTPSPGERATWTSTEWGGLITQFKGFGMASTQRVLMSGLQEKNAHVLTGALVMVGLGVLLDQVRRWQNGDQRERGFGERLTSAIDRSGILGWFMDVNNGIERLTDNQFGLGPLLGADDGRMRPLQRLEGLAGPTAGTLDRAVVAIAAYGDPRGGSARATRRLMPLNNAWWLDGLFDQVEGAMQ
jgi:hypothetical protein